MIELIRETTLTVNGLGAILIVFVLIIGSIDMSIKIFKLGRKHGDAIWRVLNAKR